MDLTMVGNHSDEDLTYNEPIKLNQSLRRKDLSLADQVRVLQALDTKKTQLQIAEEFGVSQSQVSRIRKKKDFILSEWLSNENPNRKRKRRARDMQLDDALYDWFVSNDHRSHQVSATAIRKQAEIIAKEMKMGKFLPSQGWLCRWKQRHNIGFKDTVEDRTVVVGSNNHSENYHSAEEKCESTLTVDDSGEETAEEMPENYVKSKVAIGNSKTMPALVKVRGSESSADKVGKVKSESIVVETTRVLLQSNGERKQSYETDRTVVPSYVETVNALSIIRRFLEEHPRSDFSLFYPLEIHIKSLMP